MNEATFLLAGTGALASITERFDARIALWCNDHSDLLQVSTRPEATDAILEGIDEAIGVEDALVEDGEVVVVTDACVKTIDGSTVDDHIGDHGCLLLPPLRYEDGNRICRVLSLEPDRLTACYRSLLEEFDVTVSAKRELSTGVALDDGSPFSPVAASPALTRRQRQVFTLAYQRGYYELPREITMDAIAGELGIDRRTADEHRRRAERKLLASVVDHRFCTSRD